MEKMKLRYVAKTEDGVTTIEWQTKWLLMGKETGGGSGSEKLVRVGNATMRWDDLEEQTRWP